jgi:predicted RNase H-like nuclease
MLVSEINFFGIDLAWKLNPPSEKRTAFVYWKEPWKCAVLGDEKEGFIVVPEIIP